jgi:hypothetical protein
MAYHKLDLEGRVLKIEALLRAEKPKEGAEPGKKAYYLQGVEDVCGANKWAANTIRALLPQSDDRARVTLEETSPDDRAQFGESITERKVFTVCFDVPGANTKGVVTKVIFKEAKGFPDYYEWSGEDDT